MNNFALVAYPLSRTYRQNLESTLGFTPQYLTVAELRTIPFGAMLKRLRSLQADTLVIPLEDAGSSALLPLLCGVAAIAKAKRLEIVHPDLSREHLPRLSAFSALCKGAMASIDGLLTARKCDKELDRLLASPRQEAQTGEGETLYLKTNLWFGIKAGGSVGHIAGVVNALMRRGQRVRFLSAEPPLMVDPGVHYEHVGAPAVFGMPAELNLYRYHRLFAEKSLQLVKGGVSMVYQRLSLGNYNGPLLARRLGVPLVIEYNGSEAWVQKNWGRALRYHDLAVKAEDACLKHAHVVVTISDVLRDELRERGVPADRIATYPNCIDPEIFDPALYSQADREALRAEHGIAADATLLTFIGTFGQWHGVTVFAQAIRELVDRHESLLISSRSHFMLVGDGQKYAEVSALLNEEKYARFVTFTGLVPQHHAPRYLAASDILVSPHVPNADGSRFFGSPTKLFEYMAMGKPIVASDLDQIGDIFKGSPRVTSLASTTELPANAKALLCEPGSVAELAEGLRLLLSNPQWGEPLGQRARTDALSKYTWDNHVDHILEVLTCNQREQ